LRCYNVEGETNLYIKLNIPNCRYGYVCNVGVHVMDSRTGPILTDLEIKETLPEQEFLKQVVTSIKKQISDGMEVTALKNILIHYGIAPSYAETLVCWVVTYLNLTCPDRVHIYYAN